MGSAESRNNSAGGRHEDKRPGAGVRGVAILFHVIVKPGVAQWGLVFHWKPVIAKTATGRM